MEIKNKRNKKEGRELLCRRVDALRPYIENIDYVNELRKKHPEKLQNVKKTKFYSLTAKTGIDKTLLELLESEFLPKSELV